MPVSDFDQAVNRFLAGFRLNEYDQRVPEVEAVFLIHSLWGF